MEIKGKRSAFLLLHEEEGTINSGPNTKPGYISVRGKEDRRRCVPRTIDIRFFAPRDECTPGRAKTSC